MGTLIERVCSARGTWRERHSALRLAVRAAKDCLDGAGRAADDVDLLVNAGIYRDRNLGEPALAAMIQQDIGAHPEDPHPDDHGTFSFDISNGTCGVLTALQVVDGFLAARSIDCALIVASDADPGRRMSESFPFSPAGAALLCVRTDADYGLGRIHWVNAREKRQEGNRGDNAFSATVGLVDRRNVLRFAVSADFDDEIAASAAQAVNACLLASRLRIDDVDAIVAAPAHPRYRTRLAEHLEVSSDRIVVAEDEAAHTASLAAAFERATHLDGPTGRLVLVAANAGLSAGAGLYRFPR